MNASPNNENKGYSNMVERHHRRGVNSASVITGVKTSSGRRRGLPEEMQRETEERDYQARYERELQERRQQRATERRETRQREIKSNRAEKRPRQQQVSDATKRWVYLAMIVLLAVVLLVGSVMAYGKVTGSQLFALKEIELQGTKRVSAEEMRRSLETYKTRSLWQLDLQAIRTTIEKNPWVQEAEISRVLPDSLRVTIHEREPVAPWHSPQGPVVWVDREARSLGELDFNQMENVPPIIMGLEEGIGETIKEANRKRMETYQLLLNELDQGGAKLSEEIDEVDLKEVQAVRLRLKHKINVFVGGSEFRSRLEKANKVLDAVERKDLSTLGFFKITDADRLVNGSRISYLNVTHTERVIVGLAE
jgi:cell division protein FtsQ